MVNKVICESGDTPTQFAKSFLPSCRNWRRACTARFLGDEEGAFTMFSLFIFILMIIVGGMAVDVMRFETKRVKLQNTLDAATLAATNLKQEIDSETLVRDFMAKNGYDPALVRIVNNETRVGADPALGAEGTLVARALAADYDLSVNTFFMHMVNYPVLGTTTASAAFERVQNVEISLVLDISGSMAGSKIEALKESAKQFVNAVVDDTRTANVTSISIIPYNHTVVVPDSLLDRLNTAGNVAIAPASQAPYTGALTSYPRTASGSKCVRFSESQFVTNNLQANQPLSSNPNYAQLRRITPTEVLDRMAYYDPDTKSAGAGDAYARPADDFNRRCDPTRGSILPFETSISALESHIDSLYADGNTAIDVGLKWAAALLDPAMRPVIDDMVDDNILAETVRDRPGDYDPADTMKVIVLMTDGANTSQYDLKDDFKNGPSRVWFSEKASRDYGPNGENWRDLYIVDRDNNGSRDRAKETTDGYYVLMPNNGTSTRFMRPHRLSSSSDATRVSVANLPDDARQLSYTELYDRLSERAVAQLFQDSNYGDSAAYNAHYNAESSSIVNNAGANKRMSGSPMTSSSSFGLCDAVKVNKDVLVFSIAFSAGTSAETVMRDCATDSSYFYKAENEDQLREAFASIAGAITKLRLTQ